MITSMATKQKSSDEAAATSKVSHRVKKLAKGNLEFALNLYEEISNGNKGGNVFFSPFSITVALQMTHVGARKDTAKELKDVMKLQEFHEEEELHDAFSDVMQLLNPEKLQTLKLATANRIYVQNQYEIVRDFAQTLLRRYQASAIEADFARNAEETRSAINEWVEEKTQQKIRNLVPQGALNASTRMVIVNAIYFKGSWAEQFDPLSTYPGVFHRNVRDVVKTELMRKTAAFPFVRNQDLGCKMAELRYVGGRLSMYAVLPDEIEGLENLEKRLTPDVLKSTMASLVERKVKVVLPKFKLEQGLNLKHVLRALGIQKLFSAEDADLKGMSPEGGLYVSDVIHKAFVEVNEEGTEAAAATAIVMKVRSLRIDQEPEFIADHPFLFFIYDKVSELVLFLGRFAEPRGEA